MGSGGVAKLPTGGVAFTHESSRKNVKGNQLFVTHPDCSLKGIYKVTGAPHTPKVVLNKLYINGILYNLEDFSLFQAPDIGLDIIDHYFIGNDKTTCYIPYEKRGDYSFIVGVNLTNGMTEQIKIVDSFFYDVLPQMNIDTVNNILYAANFFQFSIAKIDLLTKQIIRKKNFSYLTKEYQLIGLNNLKLYKGYLYGTFYYNDYPGILYWAKFDAESLDLLDFKKLDTPFGNSYGSYKEYFGDFFIAKYDYDYVNYVAAFYRIETGELVSKVELK